MRPSYLIQELQKLFPKLKVRDEERYLKEQELTENIGFNRMIREFVQKRHETDGAWCELYNWYKRNPKWQEKVERFLEAGYYRKPLEALTEEAAKRLYGEEFETSITRMERFAVCTIFTFSYVWTRTSRAGRVRFWRRILEMCSTVHWSGFHTKWSEKQETG